MASATTLTWNNDYDRHGHNDTNFITTGEAYLMSKTQYLSNPYARPDAVYINGVYTGHTRGDHSEMEGPIVVVRNWSSDEEAQFFVDFTRGLCDQYGITLVSAVIEVL